MSHERSTREAAMLILQRGGEPGLTWPLEGQTLTIGRNSDCNIVLDDRQVSRVHARIAWRGDHYEVEDLGSKNGTHLNGRDVVGALAAARRRRDPDRAALQAGVCRCRSDGAALDGGANRNRAADGHQHPSGVRQRQAAGAAAVGAAVPPVGADDPAPGVVGRDDIVRAVWSDAAEGGVSEQSIDALVRRLRERLGEIDPGHQYVVTMRGHGFRFENRT